MAFEWYGHRSADIILNSDYALKQEIEDVIRSVSLDHVLLEFKDKSQRRTCQWVTPWAFSSR